MANIDIAAPGADQAVFTDALVASLPARVSYKAGNWYLPIPGMTTGAGSALSNGVIKLMPFYVTRRITISDLAARITTLAVAGNIQLAIYASDSTTKRPTGAALAATGNIATDTATVVSGDITGADVTLAPGLYWMAVNSDNSTVVLLNIINASVWASAIVGSATLANITSSTATNSFFLAVTQTFGTWPDLTAASFTETTGSASGLVFFKVSALP